MDAPPAHEIAAGGNPGEPDVEDLSDEEIARLLPANPEHWTGVSRYDVPPNPVAYERLWLLGWSIKMALILLIVIYMVVELLRSLW